MSAIDAHKVLIYATSIHGLLVFDEPDFPDVGLQVPGGTIEPNEDISSAAIREFHEETGLIARNGMQFLGNIDYSFRRADHSITHRRHFFHTVVDGEPLEIWTNLEQSPYDGGPPILFRLFWLPLEEAKTRLAYGMEAGLMLMP